MGEPLPPPAREPLTDAEKKRLEELAGLGLTFTQIAGVLKTSPSTLKRRCRDTPGGYDPLRHGRAVAVSKVAKTLYQKATSGKNMTATMFYLRTQGGKKWRQPDQVELTGKNGNPIEMGHKVVILLPSNAREVDPIETEEPEKIESSA